jgi:chitin synthase
MFGPKGINIVNIIIIYFYLCLLVMCFIVTLSNRPEGSKWGYTLAMIAFAFIKIYMTISALVLAFKGPNELINLKGHKGTLRMRSFRNIVLSLAVTLGLYVFASLLFVSFPILFLPSFFL